MKIYLDNAATTPLSREVFQAMEPFIFENFGNPSSSHSYGRQARKAIEESRKTIADLLNTNPSQIIFTSGGTEADNTAIISAIRSNGIRLAITTPLEHHAVLHTLESLKRTGEIELVYLSHDHKGNLSIRELEQLLSTGDRALVSIMHGNNEIGNLNEIESIAEVCCRYDAIFHTDTVQTMGQYRYDTQQLQADFLVGSAHKFHGPKGVGFLYSSAASQITPLINGGAQERGQRSGTENVSGIVGLAKALELSYANAGVYHQHITHLKQKMIKDLFYRIPGIRFNGNSAEHNSLKTVLSVSLPDQANGLSPISYLDQLDICVSGGSACTSGSGSHVLKALGDQQGRTTIRFSFSRYNTEAEIDEAVNQLANLYVHETLTEMRAVC
ncbi:cysteine desulfurase family protein [Pedobacter sp. AW31-3R]|uniref:cysteine desulfurase family protein n=1 Tax=Pedobacter sp. AW31-3R TaxID=3445781 RepID=UPI003F9EC018